MIIRVVTFLASYLAWVSVLIGRALFYCTVHIFTRDVNVSSAYFALYLIV